MDKKYSSSVAFCSRTLLSDWRYAPVSPCVNIRVAGPCIMCCLPCIIRRGSCLNVPRYIASTTKQSEQTVTFLTHTQMLAASYETPENNIVVVKHMLQCVAALSFCSLARILRRIYFTREISIQRPVIHLKFGFPTRSLFIASRCNL